MSRLERRTATATRAFRHKVGLAPDDPSDEELEGALDAVIAYYARCDELVDGAKAGRATKEDVGSCRALLDAIPSPAIRRAHFLPFANLLERLESVVRARLS